MTACDRVQSHENGGLFWGTFAKGPHFREPHPEKGPQMALNDTVIKAAKPREKNWKLADEKGLYLLITPAGGKLWRVKFRHHNKEKKLSLGAYPEVGLAKARKLPIEYGYSDDRWRDC